MKSVSAEIDMVEKTLKELVRRPRLIRSTYWSTHIESFLARPGLRVQDRARLTALRDLIGAVAPTGDLSQDFRIDALTRPDTRDLITATGAVCRLSARL